MIEKNYSRTSAAFRSAGLHGGLKLLEMLKCPADKNLIVKDSGMDGLRVRVVLRQLIMAGLVDEKNGVYRTTEIGVKFLTLAEETEKAQENLSLANVVDRAVKAICPDSR